MTCPDPMLLPRDQYDIALGIMDSIESPFDLASDTPWDIYNALVTRLIADISFGPVLIIAGLMLVAIVVQRVRTHTQQLGLSLALVTLVSGWQVLAFIGAPTPTALPANTPVYALPTSNSPERTVDTTDIVLIDQERREWLQVRLDGHTGWVQRQNVLLAPGCEREISVENQPATR